MVVVVTNVEMLLTTSHLETIIRLHHIVETNKAETNIRDMIEEMMTKGTNRPKTETAGKEAETIVVVVLGIVGTINQLLLIKNTLAMIKILGITTIVETIMICVALKQILNHQY
jgi:hypothetical protein